MFNNVLSRIFGGASTETPTETPVETPTETHTETHTETPVFQESILPRIGRKSDLVPVDREIAGLVTGLSGIQGTYERIADKVRKTFQYDRLAITVVDTEQDTFRTAYVMGPALASESPDKIFALQDSFVSDIAASRRPILLDPQMRYPDHERFSKAGLVSRVGTPLIANGEFIGTLHLSSSKANAYVDEDLASLEEVGNEIAGAILNSNLAQAEKDRTSQLEALYRVAAILAQPQTFKAKSQAIVDTLVHIADADLAMVRRANDAGDTLELVAAAGTGNLRFKPTLSVQDDLSASSGAFRKGQNLIINDYQDFPNANPGFKSQGVASVLLMPIKSGGRTLGILSVSSKTANHFSNARVALLTAFADEIRIVFDTAELTDNLQASTAQAQAIMDTAADGIITIDQNGLIESFNHAAESIFGYSMDETIGRNVSILMPEPDSGAHITYLSHYLMTGESQIIGKGREVQGRRQDGTTFPMDLSIGVVEVGDTKVFTGIVRGITERKRTEAHLNESSRLASVGELAAGVAHEINNPLAAIILASDFLIKSGLPPETAADVKIISESAQRAARIVQNMLLFARKTQPKPEPMTVDLVVQQAMELKTHDFRINQIESSMEVEPGSPDCLIDRHQMGQVIINVLNNAEQALVSHRGGGNIDIYVRSTPEFVVLEIGDDGPGIELDLMPKIFEPFFTTKPAGEGTGLGLSICYGIIQQHGGKMWAENNEGGGTSFFIQLPIKEKELDSGPGAAPLNANTYMSKTRLLIVDDEPNLLDLVSRGLTGEIDITDQARSGDVALEMVRETNYDCILLDLKMPGIDGIEFYERVIASDPKLADRIIFMTGDTARQESADFLASKNNPVISKPFQVEHVMELIESVVSASGTS
jgi:two-component system NtrC family sensor kinase